MNGRFEYFEWNLSKIDSRLMIIFIVVWVAESRHRNSCDFSVIYNDWRDLKYGKIESVQRLACAPWLSESEFFPCKLLYLNFCIFAKKKSLYMRNLRSLFYDYFIALTKLEETLGKSRATFHTLLFTRSTTISELSLLELHELISSTIKTISIHM